MDEYLQQFVEDTQKKVNVKRRLPKIQYDAYDSVICEPYHMADTYDEALLLLDCIAETFRTRWSLYHRQEDANIAAHASMVASAFRSSETLRTANFKDVQMCIRVQSRPWSPSGHVKPGKPHQN